MFKFVEKLGFLSVCYEPQCTHSDYSDYVQSVDTDNDDSSLSWKIKWREIWEKERGQRIQNEQDKTKEQEQMENM